MIACLIMRFTYLSLMYLQEELGHYSTLCEDAYSEAKKLTEINKKLWLDSPWNNFFTDRDPMKLEPTGVPADTINHILRVFSSEPGNNFSTHAGII